MSDEIKRRERMTPEQIDRIIEAVSKGAGDTMASQCGGITRVVIWNWKTAGRDELKRREAGEPPDPGKDKFVDFYLRYTAAKGAFGMKHLERLDKTEDPKISLAILSRKYADDGWAEQPRRLEVTGRNGGDIKMVVEPLAPSRIAALLPKASNDANRFILPLASEVIDADFEEVDD
jgi:hypothetical protein